MKTILLKISGNIFTSNANIISSEPAFSVIKQIKQLKTEGYQFGIVIGGGNFFRGAQQGKQLQMQRSTADHVGMLATTMNGLILKDLFRQADVKVTLLNAIAIPGIAEIIDQETIDNHAKQDHCIIFAGGTGCPYFSTDTNAIIRALQIGAHEVWKATNVDYIYDKDPATNIDSKPLSKVTFKEAINNNLRVMDIAAYSLAHEHKMPVRIFNIATKDALLSAAHDPTFGSTITL